MERETLTVDALIVGGGPAGLAAAIHLAQLAVSAGGEPPSIAVLEKSREAGGHMLSGAVLDPATLRALIPDFAQQGAPVATAVVSDRVYWLTRRRRIRFPVTPPPLRNHGHYIVSLNHLVKWLADRAEAAGVDVFTGFAATELLWEGDRVVGVRTGDRGLDRRGHPKPTFEPGVDIRAAVTILADGVRGNLTKALIDRHRLDVGRSPQVYALGIKELWDVPATRVPAGTVIHTLGYPLRSDEFGGGFVYALPAGRLSVGFVVGLDYRDPRFDPHRAFQRFKSHPLVRSLLEGGQMVRYGAKALPEGGWRSIPRLHVDGALIVGDAAGFLNSVRLKGIHLAMRTGMHAAQVALEAIRAGDASATRLARYQSLIDEGAVRRELYPVRNVHRGFDRGLWRGLAVAGVALATSGRWPRDRRPGRPGHERMEQRFAHPSDPIADTDLDGAVTFDRLTNVHYSETKHVEDQPVHLLVRDTDICRTRCREEFGNPCEQFCPASVYEMVEDETGSGTRLQINASNCVHCKTCDIMDPYQVIDWVPPEGGGGPRYEGM